MKAATQQVSQPTCRGYGWMVPSTSGTGQYYVELDHERHIFICECPDWIYRGRKRGQKCKHLRLIESLQAELVEA